VLSGSGQVNFFQPLKLLYRIILYSFGGIVLLTVNIASTVSNQSLGESKMGYHYTKLFIIHLVTVHVGIGLRHLRANTKTAI